VKAQFKFLSGARTGQIETFRKAYIGLGRHPLSDVRFDAERDLDVSSRHAAIMRRPDGFVLQDLGSKNGTYVNGDRITGDRVLKDGDVIGFGAKGPAVEFHAVTDGDEAATHTAAGEDQAGRMSQPRQVVRATPASAPRPSTGRSTTAIRAAIESATRQWRRTTKVLFGLMILVIGLAAFVLWKDSHARVAESQRMEAQVQGLREANQQALAEIERLRSELSKAGSDTAVQRLRGEIRAAHDAAGVDWRAVAQHNSDAVALVIVEFSEQERFSGTAFAVDSQGTLITNKHVLVGEAGDRTPRRIAVKFSGSKQWFAGRFIGVSSASDIGVLKVDIKGGTPRVLSLQRDSRSLERGDPVAIMGYPLGLDLPMEGQGLEAVASPTMTIGTASKVLSSVVQVDGYGAPGSSGSPIFDRNGNVVAVLYGGITESNGKIILAVPASFVADYLRTIR
jgi:S1-C subfamily serine protease